MDQPLEVTLRQVVAAAGHRARRGRRSIISWGTATGRVDVYADESFPAGYPRGARQTWAALHPGRRGRGHPAHDRGDARVPQERPVASNGSPACARLWVDAGWDDVVVAVPLSAQGRSFGELHVYLPAGTGHRR